MHLVYFMAALVFVSGAMVVQADVCYLDDTIESIKGGTNDVIAVRQSNGNIRATPLNIRVGKFDNFYTLFRSREGKKAMLYVNTYPVQLQEGRHIVLTDSGQAIFDKNEECSFTALELDRMRLKSGRNQCLFRVGSLDLNLTFFIYLLDQNDRLVVTDVDGTITKSDITGFLLPKLGISAHHDFVVELLQKIRKRGHYIIYLTARPIALCEGTRNYLFHDLKGRNGELAPFNPLLCSPGVIMHVLDKEDEVESMKTSVLRGIIDLFEDKENVVLGAYGNKISDTNAYKNVGISPDKIFVINKDSQVVNVGTGLLTSYRLLTQRVDELY